MSDNINYDELDKAVNKAIKANSKKAAPKASANISTPSAKVVAKPATSRPHAQYMDFVRRAPNKIIHHSKPVTIPEPQPTVAPKPATRPKAKLRAAAPVVAPKPARLIPNAATKPATPVIRKTVAKPATANMPQYRTASANARVAAKAAAQTPKAEPAPAPAPAKPAVKPAEKPAPKYTAPNANNFSLGGKSPFLTNAQVEKTPLGKNPQQTSANSIESTKNTYSQKSPLASKIAKKHIITEEPKGSSGWMRVLAVILMIAAGLGLGLLAWLIISPNLGK